MHNYETGAMLPEEMRKFTAYVDDYIGTEYEVDMHGWNDAYLTALVLDLSRKQVEALKKLENKLVPNDRDVYKN